MMTATSGRSMVMGGRTLDSDYLRSLLFIDDFDGVFGSGGGNPGHKFAAAIGLRHFEWLSGHYMEHPDAPGVPGMEYVG
ncbi:MAG: hypothetical protein GY720_17415 [bacterium]|nr:hypothetical protein [bacterium]